MVSEYMKQKAAGSSAIRKMFDEGKQMAAKYGPEKVFDFSLGNPIVPPPEAINDTVKRILENYKPGEIHGYMNNSGYPEVREKLADFENKTKGTDLSEEHIVMTCGAAGGLNVILRCILNPGDEVITFAPFFTEYTHYATNNNGVLKVVPPNPPTFQPDMKAFEEAFTDKTKAVLINSPNNPTGVVYSEETVEGLAEICRLKQEEYGHSIVMLSDEPYREIFYSGEKLPYLLNYYENSMVVYSYSKSLSLPGERIGYVTVNPRIEECSDLLIAMNVANRILGYINASSLFQRVVGELIGETVNVDFYRKNRDALLEILEEVGLETAPADGTFYLFVKSPIEDEVAFCNKAKEYNLLLVPARGFGCPGYFRMAYCTPYETVINSYDSIRKLMANYQ